MSSISSQPEPALDFPLPPHLMPCRSTALLVSCSFSQDFPQGPLRLAEVSGGSAEEFLALGPFLRVSQGSQEARAYLTIVLATAAGPAPLTLHFAGETSSGSTARVSLPPIPTTPFPDLTGRLPQRHPNDEICICMATYDPDLELFRRQLESIARQSYDRWFCIISDDSSPPRVLEAMRTVIAGDNRFALLTSDQRRGFYRNFERALFCVPPTHSYVALADQDDVWHPDKLAVLASTLESTDAVLCYSDQRITSRSGTVLSGTLWRGRRNEYRRFRSIVCANTITGASTLFKRELLDILLPFPETPGFQFHDHWLAVCAVSSGQVAYVDRPLYDYVQHEGAVLGHLREQRGTTWAHLLRRVGDRGHEHRLAHLYFAYLPAILRVLTVRSRLGDALEMSVFKDIEELLALHRSPTTRLRYRLLGLASRLFKSAPLGTEGSLALGAGALASLASGRTRGNLRADVPSLSAFEQPHLRRWRAGLTGNR